jgi:hypothetical protein
LCATQAAQNKILHQAVNLSAADVVVDQANRRVTVTVPRTGANGINAYFARVLGYQQLNVSAHASAEASRRAQGTHCIKPFFLPNTILSPNPSTACGAAQQVIFTAQGNLSTFVQNKWGTPLSLRPVSPSAALAPSQFYSLQLGGSGAATYQCAIQQCLDACSADFTKVHCGDAFPLQTGNMSGPTTQGVNNLVGDNPDVWLGVGQYETFTGTIMDESKSVITVPVWDDCTQPISSGYHGQTLNVIGFLALFVDGVQGQSVTAHLVNAAACSTTGGSGPGSATGPMAIPIRLVQPQ